MTVKEHHSVRELLKLNKSQSNIRMARRIQAIALAQQGYSSQQIAKMTGSCRRAIQNWVARYNKDGIDGLKEKSGRGRTPKLPASEYQKLCSRIDLGPTDKDKVASLYGKDIQRILNREFHVLYSLTGVYQLLHRLGYSYLRPRPRHQKADPQAQQHFKKTSQIGSEKWQ